MDIEDRLNTTEYEAYFNNVTAYSIELAYSSFTSTFSKLSVIPFHSQSKE